MSPSVPRLLRGANLKKYRNEIAKKDNKDLQKLDIELQQSRMKGKARMTVATFSLHMIGPWGLLGLGSGALTSKIAKEKLNIVIEVMKERGISRLKVRKRDLVKPISGAVLGATASEAVNDAVSFACHHGTSHRAENSAANRGDTAAQEDIQPPAGLATETVAHPTENVLPAAVNNHFNFENINLISPRHKIDAKLEGGKAYCQRVVTRAGTLLATVVLMLILLAITWGWWWELVLRCMVHLCLIFLFITMLACFSLSSSMDAWSWSVQDIVGYLRFTNVVKGIYWSVTGSVIGRDFK